MYPDQFDESNMRQLSNEFFPEPFTVPNPNAPSAILPPFGGPNTPPMPPPPFGGPGIPPFGGPTTPPPPPPPSGGTGASPMGPPPSFTPMMSNSQVGSSGIRQCMYRNTFIWLRSGESFWFFPTFVTTNIILGFRWGRFGWMYSTVNRGNILTFQCF